MHKKTLAALLLVIFITAVFPAGLVFAAAEYTLDIANTDATYTNVDGFSSYAAAYDALEANSSRDAVVRNRSGKVIAMKEGMVITDSYSSTLVFSSTYSGGIPGYCSNGVICYYMSTDRNQNVTFSVSSYRATASVSELILIPSAFTYPRRTTEYRPLRYEFDYYEREGNDLVHYISLYNYSTDGTDMYGLTIDKAPSFMDEGIRYYSLDSISYFKDPIDAVKGENCIGTHYIYYKFLSFRSETNYSKSELNSYIAYRNATTNPSHTSVYLNNAEAFLNAQASYGINAVLEIAFADLESGYGKSEIARDKNNIFGINAVDSSAYESADAYPSVGACIMEHAKYTLSRDYLDAYAYVDSSKGSGYYDVSDRYSGWINDYRGDSRYFGSCTGSKLIGVSVKYASDPWHGEKIASRAYMLDKYLGLKDYGKYTIAVTNSLTYAYSEASADSFALYKYTTKDPSRNYGDYSYGPIGMPMIVLGEVGDFYVVRSEIPVNSEGRGCNSWSYDFSTSVAYVKKSNVDIVYRAGTIPDYNPGDTGVGSDAYDIKTEDKTIRNILSETLIFDFVQRFTNGSAKVYKDGNEVTDGYVKTGMEVKLYEEDGTFSATYTAIITGDINGDGKISSTDIVKLARHMAGIEKLSGAKLLAADINKNGSVTSTDIVKLARHLADIESFE